MKGRFQLPIVTERFIIFGVIQVILFIIAMNAGQDVNWDQLNYHMYIGATWLKGFSPDNLLPAQIQTWLNPLGVIFTTLPVLCLPPIPAVFILCLYSTACLFLIYLITQIVLNDVVRASHARIYGILAMAIAAATPSFLSEIGTTYNDNLISAIILLALMCFLKFLGNSRGNILWLAGTGLLLGVAAGLKLSALFYLFSFCLSLFIFKYVFRFRYRSLIFCFACIACGFIITYAFWGFHLYHEYGNPLFPFYNGIFRSAYFFPKNVVDPRFTAKDIAEYLLYPFKCATINNFHQELFSRYIQMLVFTLLFLFSCCYFIIKKKSGKEFQGSGNPGLIRIFFFLLTFSCFSYFLWLATFGVQRYFMTIELLLGLLITVILILIIYHKTMRILLLSVIFLLSAGFIQYPNWGRMPYSGSWYSESLTEKGKEGNILYVMNGGGEPYSYIIPFFPSSCRFIRVTGSLSMKKIRTVRLYQDFITMVANHDTIFSIYPEGFKPNNVNLAFLGLEPVPGQTEILFITTKINRYVGVRLRKTTLPGRDQLK